MHRNWLPSTVAALTALLVVTGGAGIASAQTNHDKLDRALREGRRSGKAQRVIVKAKPGYEAWARELLAQKGKSIDAELPSIGALAVELTPAELELCKSGVLDGCSEDSYVRPTGAAARKAAAPARDTRKNSKTSSVATPVYSAPALNTLLGTLGLTPSPLFGSGVTVAVIDSGIHPSASFAGRILAFYDFTTGGIRA
ncbi:MAG TPA: hypothetical protein VNT81_20640, partial [Vicinamibacterales bacterium]|nr:hypothetical protein [Vicinamibacterales bacterium]